MAGPQSCDTFVVLPPMTQHGVIFGKNSDRPSAEVQEVVYVPATAPSGDTKCTYIEVESGGPTKAVILSKPGWMWGAEMGANECGVVVGNEAVWTNDNAGDSDTTVKRLLGMDLVRLGLERSSTADEALDVICQLLERYGQGGPCSQTDDSFTYHNSFLIADATCAWILETSGKNWVAEKVTSGYRNISNILTITTKIDKKSDGILEYAKARGLWSGEGEFNFAECFGGEKSPGSARYDGGRRLLQQLTKADDFQETSMFAVLRDKDSGICQPQGSAFATQASQVSVLGRGRPCVHWFTATPDPSISVFKPFIFTAGATISRHTRCPDDQPSAPHTLYSLHAKAMSSDNNQVMELLRGMEAECVDELRDLLESPDGKSSELDELFKDCVETEVKFYR